jgi:glycerate 2-kinase
MVPPKTRRRGKKLWGKNVLADGSGTEFEARALLRRLFDAAVSAAHPATTLPAALPEAPRSGRILLLSTGKAGGSMMVAAVRHYEAAGVSPERLFGLGTARHGYEGERVVIPVIGAGHPVPDDASVAAANRTLAIAAEARPDDIAVALISGGGSANWIAPAAGLALAGKQAINKALLRSGAPIGEMNCVRKHLSRIKGGRLAAQIACRLHTLAISDVPGDDPSVIASGPTVADPTTLAEARAIVAKRGIALPPAAVAALADPANETPKPGDPLFARTAFDIITRPRDALAAAVGMARARGYHVIDLGPDVEGEAREVAAVQARLALELKAAGRRAIILSGGELTVTMKGHGRGGPNQEFALALAIALGGAAGIHALAADTDGTDGGRGEPTDPAGALIGPGTLAAARAAGLDPAAMLADNDSTGFFEKAGGLLATGPTLTNANDLRAILVEGHA